MSTSSLETTRAQLREERGRLRERLHELGLGADDSLDFDGGFADSSQVTAERGEMEALAGTLTDTLREVEDALTKLDDGTYGRCEACGGPIPPARLEAKPAARLCIACASQSR
jgi:RNA polymerase-binding transcription factor DksA